MKDLQSQVESRQQREAQDQQSRLLLEHRDQVQLVQEWVCINGTAQAFKWSCDVIFNVSYGGFGFRIALQKAQQLQQKLENTKHYKRALDTQARKCVKGDRKYPYSGSWVITWKGLHAPTFRKRITFLRLCKPIRFTRKYKRKEK